MPDSEPDPPFKQPAGGAGRTDLAEREPKQFDGILSELEVVDEKENTPRRKKRRDEMGFFDHLEELRMVIMKSIFAIVIGVAIVGTFFIKFFALLRYPLEVAIGEEATKGFLISTSPMGVIMIIFQTTIIGGFVLALPAIAYFIGQFVAPAMTPREKGLLRPALIAALLLFLGGAATCFFFMLPIGLKVGIKAGDLLDVKNMWTVQEYYSLVAWATLATGLVFEFPLILVILQVLGVVETATLRGTRRYAVVIIMVIGALIAPSPDPSSMFMMAIPMYLLFEASLIVGAMLRKRRLAAQTRSDMTDGG